MIHYEVGKPFPHPNLQLGRENCRAQIVGSSFDILYFIRGASKSDVRTFRDSPLMFHIYVEGYVPFIVISYIGSDWTFDLTLNVAEMSSEDARLFFALGNAVTLFLIDAGSANTLLAARMIGLPIDAEQMIKDALTSQREAYTTSADVKRVIDRVYLTRSTDELMREGERWEFKR